MAQTVRKTERVNLVAAIEHCVGKSGTTEEHADHGPRSRIAAQCDQFTGDQMWRKVCLGNFEQSAQRLDRIAPALGLDDGGDDD